MFVCPKSTTHLHKFQQGDRLYVADLSQCLVLEIDDIVWEILDLCPSFSSEEIIERLEGKYNRDLVIAALNTLSTLEQRGVLFSDLERNAASQGKETTSQLKILVLQAESF